MYSKDCRIQGFIVQKGEKTTILKSPNPLFKKNINELLFNRNGQKLFRNFSLIIFSKIIIPDNSLQDLHEVPEHLRSARKRHRSALCDALPDKEVPSAWSISDNSCKKIISAIRLNPLFKKNLCISVGEYSLYSSYCFSLRPATFGSCS